MTEPVTEPATEPATGSTILPVTGLDGRPRAGSSSTGAGKPSRWSQFFATPARATLAAIAVIVVVLALWIWRCSEQLLPGAFWRSWWLQVPDLLLALGVGLVVGSIVVVLARLVRRRLPWLLVCVLVFGAVLLFTMGAGASLVGWLVIAVVALAASATWGWFLGTLSGRDRPHRYSAAGWSGFGVTTVAALLVVGYLVWPGPGANPTAAATPSGAMTDPAAPGPFRVISTAYGSGKSSANPAYGPGVAIRTRPVDASALIKGWDSGSTRSEIWGFTAAALPLNALVWAPDGQGPFPLVVMLHGNTPFDDSEAGFEYLGTLLAQPRLPGRLDRRGIPEHGTAGQGQFDQRCGYRPGLVAAATPARVEDPERHRRWTVRRKGRPVQGQPARALPRR